MEDGDLDFMQEGSPSEGGQTQNLSQTLRRTKNRNKDNSRQPGSQVSSQNMGINQDGEDDTSRYQVAAAIQSSLQSQNPRQNSIGMNASRPTLYSMVNPFQQVESCPNQLITFASGGNSPIPAWSSYLESPCASNPNTYINSGNTQAAQAPQQYATHASFLAPQHHPSIGTGNQSWEGSSSKPTPRQFYPSQSEKFPMFAPRNARTSATAPLRNHSAFSSVQSRKRNGSD